MQIKAYFSHPIRGTKGEDATMEDIVRNNQIAIVIAKMLRRSLPVLDLYVPAEHDEFVSLAYKRGILSELDILEIDKEILQDRDCIIGYEPDGYISRGMQVEYDCATRRFMPRFTIRRLYDIPDVCNDIFNWWRTKLETA